MSLRKLVILAALALAVTAIVVSPTETQCFPPDGMCTTTY